MNSNNYFGNIKELTLSMFVNMLVKMFLIDRYRSMIFSIKISFFILYFINFLNQKFIYLLFLKIKINWHHYSSYFARKYSL